MRAQTCALFLLSLMIVTAVAGCGDDGGSGSNENDATVQPGCGNGVVEGSEECDDGIHNSDTAPDACRTNCRRPFCGDDVADTIESCDGVDLSLMTCTDLGMSGGTLRCASDCSFDTSQCYQCGNSILDPNEPCDGVELGGESCETYTGVQHGTLTCTPQCTLDPSDCHTCGNGMVEGPEMCEDGNTVDGDGCSANCLSDEECGNGYIDVLLGEECDDATANSNTVPDACRTDCVQAHCGDSVIDTGEICDSTNLGGMTCQNLGLGFNGGVLACDACQYDTTGCFTCGNSICEPEETPSDCPGDCPVVKVAADEDFTCALMSDGTARCWGCNNNGQLGNGSTTDATLPVPVANLANAVDLDTGSYHTCAVIDDGTVRCWGSNSEGQLGDGSTNGSATPVTVSNLSNAVQVSCGHRFTCAVADNGTVWCWGNDEYSQLGDGVVQVRSTIPVPVTGLTNAVAVATGGRHSCALLATGTVACWGTNSYGQLGDGTTDISDLPVPVSNLVDTASIGIGEQHSCAVLNDGTAWCWGRNENYRLGDGTNVDRHTPFQVTALTQTLSISGGSGHTCARLPSEVRCWGYNLSGQCGNGTETQNEISPVTVVGLDAAQLDLGNYHACAVQDFTTVYCWGRGSRGQLGNGDTADASAPVNVSGL